MWSKRFFRPLTSFIAAIILVSAQFMPAFFIFEYAAADGNGSPVECEDTTTNVVGSITGSGDLVTYNAGANNTIAGVCIKSGEGTFNGVTHSEVLNNGTYDNGCYTVAGVGTQSVTITRTKDDNCKDIRHIDAVVNYAAPTVTLKKVVSPSDDNGTFDLYVDNALVIDEAMNGNVSNPVEVNSDTNVVVKELPGYGLSSFEDYTTNITCTNQDNEILYNVERTELQSRSLIINASKINDGDSILCVFTNTAANEEPGRPYVQVTFICKATFTGTALVWDGSQNQHYAVNNGDYVFRLHYRTDKSEENAPATVPYETKKFVTSGDIDKGEILFKSSSQSVASVSVVTNPENLYKGTASTNENENQRCQQLQQPVDFCDPANRPAGMSIGEWLDENDFDGSDCFEIEEVEECGYFNVLLDNKTGLNYEVRYVIGEDMPELNNWEGDGTLPVNLSEDYNGGSVEVTYYIVGEESDYVRGFGLPNIWDGEGETETVDTDCEGGGGPIGGSVTVTKFNDENKNGKWDEGEETLEGWEMILTPDSCSNGTSNESLASIIDCPTLDPVSKFTDENGEADFAGLMSGRYTLTETEKEGWTQTVLFCEQNDFIYDISNLYEATNRFLLPEIANNQVWVFPGSANNCYVGNYKEKVPAIHIEKEGPDVAEAGSTIDYTFTVTNVGDVPLSNIQLTDTLTGYPVYVSGDTNEDGILDLDETWIYEDNYTIPENQGAPVVNEAEVCGMDNSYEREDLTALETAIEQVCDQDTHTTTVPQVLGDATTEPRKLAETGNSMVLVIATGLSIILLVLVMQKAVASDK